MLAGWTDSPPRVGSLCRIAVTRRAVLERVCGRPDRANGYTAEARRGRGASSSPVAHEYRFLNLTLQITGNEARWAPLRGYENFRYGLGPVPPAASPFHVARLRETRPYRASSSF